MLRGRWSVSLGLGCALVHTSLGEPWKGLGLGMPGLGLMGHCFASNTNPDGEVTCVSDLEVFV